jgi:hypothetical protein
MRLLSKNRVVQPNPLNLGFGIENRLDLTARYNIAPSQDVPVIVPSSPNRIDMTAYERNP